MTNLPVTRTKILVPRRRAELLSRRRLLDLLDELLEYRLIIVAAPAGYGKTSLLVDFAQSTPWPVCWYALDAMDQDPYRFIAHFISAISVRFPTFGQSCLAALQSMGQEHLDIDVISSLIINDAYDNVPEHFILVLDDFHLVEGSPAVVNFVNRFIQDADENCHLAIASRTLLTLPDLPLMVARAQVGGLSYDELSFQPDEIQRLLQQNYNLTLSDGEAKELARAAEGWVTGLLLSTQLMGKTIANRLRVARVSGVGLYEYLANQVLAQQAPEVQSFLLRTSLLDEFDERLCQEVIGVALEIEPDWRALMDVVTRANLFVLPVGEEGQVLRYHHLFQDFLRDRVQRNAPAESRLILLRLAQVYAAREEWDRAYPIYQRLDETQQIVRLVEQAGSTMIAQGRLLTLSGWLDSLPAALLDRHPSLVSLMGAVTADRGDAARGLEYLNRAVEAFREARMLPSRQGEAVRSSDTLQLALALVRRSVAYRLLGRYRLAGQDAAAALELLSGLNGFSPQGSSERRSAASPIPSTPSSSVNPAAVYADALQSQGKVLYALGQLNEALAMLQQARMAYQELEDTTTTAKVWMEIGMVYRALGQFDAAERAYQQPLNGYGVTGNLVLQANLHNSLGVLRHQRGDYVNAAASLEKAIRYARAGGAPRLEAYALASIGDLYLELDAHEEARQAYHRSRDIARQIGEGYLLFYLDLAEARLELTLASAAAAAPAETAQPGAPAATGAAHAEPAARAAQPQGAPGSGMQAAVGFLDAAQAAALQRGSPYEQNAVHLEAARLALLSKEPIPAFDLARAALDYFIEGQFHGEVPRARLLVFLAALHTLSGAGEGAAGKKKQGARAGEQKPAAQASAGASAGGEAIRLAAEALPAQAAELRRLLDNPENRKLLAAALRELKTLLPPTGSITTAGASAAEAREVLAALHNLLSSVEQAIPNLRRQIRRQAVTVPFAPPKMFIRAFGRAQVHVTEPSPMPGELGRDRLITSSDWQVQVARDLFFLLLAHPEGLTKEQIGEIFWPDSTPAELKLRFKNTIYRLRHAAGKDAILFQGENFYLFNRASDYEYDVEMFQKELDLAARESDPALRREHLRAAAALYQGHYLPDVDDTWAVTERERLFQSYVDALLDLANLAYEARDYEEALSACQQILKEDTCQEEAHRIAMRIHAAMGNRALVVRQYEMLTESLMEELAAEPSPQTQELYELLTE